MGTKTDFSDLAAETFQIEEVRNQDDPARVAAGCVGESAGSGCCTTSGTPIGEAV